MVQLLWSTYKQMLNQVHKFEVQKSEMGQTDIPPPKKNIPTVGSGRKLRAYKYLGHLTGCCGAELYPMYGKICIRHILRAFQRNFESKIMD